MSIVSQGAEAPRASYHHGDLHRALIEAGLALMEEQANWDFSLRELARRAGVSHNAPYKHFAGKHALQMALARAGFETLRDVTEAAAQGVEKPDEALLEIGAAYVRFGRSRPAHYRLMFGALLTGSRCAPPEDVSAVAQASKAVLRRVIQTGIDAGVWGIPPAALDTAVLAAWSLVHGITLLFLDGFIPTQSETEADRITRSVIRLQTSGFYK